MIKIACKDISCLTIENQTRPDQTIPEKMFSKVFIYFGIHQFNVQFHAIIVVCFVK